MAGYTSHKILYFKVEGLGFGGTPHKERSTYISLTGSRFGCFKSLILGGGGLWV